MRTCLHHIGLGLSAGLVLHCCFMWRAQLTVGDGIFKQVGQRECQRRKESCEEAPFYGLCFISCFELLSWLPLGMDYNL